MITSALAGFAASMGLIAAIGAQNAFVLRQGLRREHVWPVVLTCAASDALLISVGVAGLGAAIARQPTALTAVRWGGAAFLLCYAALAFRRALQPGSLVPTNGQPTTLRATILACLAFTYLNPHVYLDTVLLLGSVANQYRHQWAFGAAAALASAVWFTAIGVGARRLAPLLARPISWRVLDGVVGLLMVVLAGSLVVA
ncbi:MAG TPA: LysE/ArgO family amino acid transporter [Micromonospora sp.]|nr:LysE/ArgO family amino acid transporter [Micromonospora sp.]